MPDSEPYAVNDEYDVVVVGCGMAGLAAALSASEQDASTVVLEKSPKEMRGGQTQYTESWRIPTADIDLDLDFHVPDYSTSDLYRDIMHQTDGLADAELTKTLTDDLPAAFEWLTEHLREQGFEWQTVPLRELYTVGRVWHEGRELVNALCDAVREVGAEIEYEKEARELITDESGGVSGLRVKDETGMAAYHANAVIIACGGFESNVEKRARYFGEPFDTMTVRGVRHNTGEAIDMALAIGARPEGQWTKAHMTIIDAGSPPYEGGQTLVSGYQYGIILNHHGERFVDEGEDVRAHTYAKIGRSIMEQPFSEAFVIQDSETNEYVFHSGPTDPITAESIEELVNRLDIGDNDASVDTVTRYNASCDAAQFDYSKLDGNSADAVSPPKSNWAKPLTSPPFYGYPVTGGITFTFGGLDHSSRSEVLDTSDERIPGLYAAGNATGGMFYNNYPGSTGLPKALVFGRIAGRNAAECAKLD